VPTRSSFEYDHRAVRERARQREEFVNAGVILFLRCAWLLDRTYRARRSKTARARCAGDLVHDSRALGKHSPNLPWRQSRGPIGEMPPREPLSAGSCT